MRNPSSSALFILGCYAFASLGVSAALLGPSLPTLAARANVSLDQVGFIFVAMSLGYLTSAPVINAITPIIGARNMLVVSPLVVIASLLSLALGAQMAVFLIAAYLFGLGQAGTQVAYNAMFGTQADSAKASAVLNRLNAFYGAGALIGPFFVAASYRLIGDATLAFWLAAALALPLSIGALAASAPIRTLTTSSLNQAKVSASNRVLTSPVVWAMCAVMGLYVGCEVAFSGWTTEFARQTTGVDVAQAAITVSAFWAALALSRYFSHQLVRRIAPSAFVFLTIVVAMAGMLVMILAGGVFAIVMAGAFVVGLGCGPVYPTLIAIGIQRFPHTAQLIASLLTSAGSFGAFFLPTLTGFVLTAPTAGPASAWLLLIGMLAIAIGLWALARRDLIAHSPTSAVAIGEAS
jgi:fucose permease